MFPLSARRYGAGFEIAKIQTSMTIRMTIPPKTILWWIFRSPLLTGSLGDGASVHLAQVRDGEHAVDTMLANV